MSDAYLLDTSIASIAWDGGNMFHTYVRQRLADLDADYISVCSISIGEVTYGLQVSQHPDHQRHNAIKEAMLEYKIWDIDRHTAETFGVIRGEIFRNYGTPKKRGSVKERQPEDLLDKTTAKMLGIQENDLWIVSVAVQYDLRFITKDRKMQPVLDAAKNTYSYDLVDIWLLESQDIKSD